MIAVLPELNTGIEQRTPAPNNKKSGRCYIHMSKKNRQKSRKHCSKCTEVICAEHSTIKIFCNNCNE
jgi:hypothetical protein